MANWISYIKDDLGSGDDTRDGMITNGPTHGVQLSQELPPLVGFTTIASTGTLHVAGTLKLDGQLKDGDNAFGTSGQVLSSDGTDTKWVSSGSLAAGAASQVAINDDSNANAERFITFVDASSGNNSVKTDPQFKYNPSTNTITTANISGTILTASQTNITSVGPLNTLTVNGTINVNNGNVIQLRTSTNNTLRGYIQATETNDAHLIIATSGGEDIAFKDGGLGGTTNMRIRGDGNVIVTGSVTANGFSGDLTGNADTATKLAAAINIGGVSFDGSTAINLPGVNQAGNQDTSGNAATATVLETARSFSIGGEITANAISFNGNGAVALSATIDNNIVDEANLKISNGGTDGMFLQKQSGNSGGLTWASVTLPTAGTLSGATLASGITASSLTSVGTLGSLSVTNTATIGGDLSVDGVATFGASNVTRNLKIQAIGSGTDTGISGYDSSGNWRYQLYGSHDGSNGHYGFLNANWGGWDIRKTVGGEMYLNGTTNKVWHSGNDGPASGLAAQTAATATTASNSSTSRIRTDNGDAYHRLIFVDSGTDNQDQILKMDDEGGRLQWNPHQENLVTWTTQTQGLRQWSNGNLGTAGQVLTSGGGSEWTWANAFVTGMIMLWSGAANAIPSGWVLCNGSNSTPDLRNRFVVGAGDSYSVGATGGANSVTLSTAQLPAHSHTTNNHRHSFSGSGSSSHSHDIASATGHTGYNILDRNRGTDPWTSNYNTTSVDTESATVSISISGNTGYSNPSTNNTGSGNSHENRPPYYALCYIMKT